MNHKGDKGTQRGGKAKGDRLITKCDSLLSSRGLRGAEVLDGPVDHRLHLSRVLYFAAFSQNLSGVVGTEPGWVPIGLVGAIDQVHFHQESLDHKFAHSRRFPEDALGM